MEYNRTLQERIQQINVFNDLKLKLNRIPQKKEWIHECKSQGVSAEISRPSSPLRKYRDLQETAINYNHRVKSIKFDGYEDVYNGTVDEYHNYVCAHETKTKSGMPKISGVYTKNCGEFVFFRLRSFFQLQIRNVIDYYSNLCSSSKTKT